jgi:hypothetical protein
MPQDKADEGFAWLRQIAVFHKHRTGQGEIHGGQSIARNLIGP